MVLGLTRLIIVLAGCFGLLTATLAQETVGTGEAAAPTSAQPAAISAPSFFPAELAQRVARVASDIESAAKGIERVKSREDGLTAQRLELERIEVEAQQVIDALRPRLAAVKAQVQKLGPPPDKDAAPEAPAIASERSRLTAVQAELEGAVKTVELALVRSRQLVGHVQRLRQALFARDLVRHSGSPLSPATWKAFAAELPRTGRQIARLAAEWWRLAGSNLVGLGLVLAAAVGAYALFKLPLSHIRRRIHESPIALRQYFPRAIDAFWLAAGLAFPPLAAATVGYVGLAWLGLLTVTAGELALSALRAFVVFQIIRAMAGAAFSPTASGQPLIAIADASAPKLLFLANLLAGLIALDLLLGDVVRMLYLPIEIGAVQATATSLAFAALLIAFTRVPLAGREAALLEAPSRSRPRWLKIPIALAALTIVATTLAGYVALGKFITTQVMLIGGLGLFILSVHLVIRRVAVVMTDGERPMGRILETRLGLDHDRTSYLTRLLVLLVELLLLLAALPLLLLTWGYTREDFLDWLRLGIVGIEIGQFQISLGRILLSFALFFVLLFATRVVQRWLDRSVLGPARVDRSIAHSVLMGVGYTGVGLALVIALSYAGLDFTKLAIVAGALSLGIGFGLQAIFNNFVSGIILLIERPIKVGDWIVVNGQEGFVRRINVRATEIETFDRSSLIIPNSELITGTVMNWTHRNLIGRLIVSVRVSYKADPEQVMKILADVVDRSPSLLREPAPLIVFEDFGESAMMFSVRAFVPDVMRRLTVQSELRLAIAKAFRDAGIEIPYRQHDIHLRDLDGVKQAFARALEARRREQEVEAGDTSPAS